MPDPKQLIPKNMPFTIYADEQYINWSDEERAFFASEEKYQYLLEKFPGGLHIKSEGAGIKIGWAFQSAQTKPSWDIPKFELFPQIVLKGASRFIPALNQYANNIPAPLVEFNGFYTRTKENWPLIGSTKMPHVYAVGALAGYGTMAACAAGELCAQYVFDETQLPDYASYFHPERYSDVRIMKELQRLDSDGQL